MQILIFDQIVGVINVYVIVFLSANDCLIAKCTSVCDFIVCYEAIKNAHYYNIYSVFVCFCNINCVDLQPFAF